MDCAIKFPRCSNGILICCLLFGGCGVRDPVELVGDSGLEESKFDVGPDPIPISKDVGVGPVKMDIGGGMVKMDIGGGTVKMDIGVGPDCACIVDVGLDYYPDVPCPTELPMGEYCDDFNKGYCGYEVDESYCECGLQEGWIPETSCWCSYGTWTCETAICKPCIDLDGGSPDGPDACVQEDGASADGPYFETDCADVSFFGCGFYAYCDGSAVIAWWHEHEYDDASQVVEYECGHFCPSGCDDSSFHWSEDGADLVQNYCLP